MKRMILLSLFGVLLLSACNKEDDNTNKESVNDGEASNEYGSIDHGVDDSGIGFNMSGGDIEEAANVPAEEKQAILNAFEKYMDAFNDEDIDAYMDTLSENPKSFDIKEERGYIEGIFAEYEVQRDAADETVVKYDEESGEAQVFANLTTTLKSRETGESGSQTGRQVTVFTKEDGGYKVTSVHYLGDAE